MAADWAEAPPSVLQRWPEVLDPWLKSVLGRQTNVAPPQASIDDWQVWQQAMAGHGLLPLLSNWLKDRADATGPPASVMEVLKQAYLRQVALVAVRYQQLGRLLDTVAARPQRALVLKGAALGETLYPDPAFRPASDIDLLVRPKDYPKVREALLGAGYCSRKGRRPNQFDWAGEEEFVMDGVPNWFMVDLHWTLSPFTWAEQPALLESLFREAHSTALRDGRILVLSLTHALVHAALHLAYANFDNVRLIWVYDVHLLAQQIEQQGLWPEMFSAARQWYARLALVDALLLAREWFGTSLPLGLSDPGYAAPLEAEWNVYNVVHGSGSTQEKLQRLRLANLNQTQRLSFYYDRLLPSSHEIDLNYPSLQNWPYPLKAIGRLAAILFNRGKRG